MIIVLFHGEVLMRPVVLIVLAAIFGCASSAMAEPDLRRPREVLPGHWKDTAGKLHYYFDQERVTMINGGELVGTYPYEIVEEDSALNLIRIKLKSANDGLREIRVDFKRKGFMETLRVEGVTINNIMLYVDDRRTP